LLFTWRPNVIYRVHGFVVTRQQHLPIQSYPLMMTIAKKSPIETAHKDPTPTSRLCLFYWLLLVASFAIVHITVFSKQFRFDATDLRCKLMKQSDKVNENYPALGGASFSALQGMASQQFAHIQSFHIDDFYRDLHQRIDSIPPNERCAAFGPTQ
jgi:hypothetical protein